MFPKKHIPKKQTHATHTHAHKSQHLHSHHAKHTTQTKHVHTPHTHHAFMYGKIYACTYCGRKGHMAKFYFDRTNASNYHVWVHSANIKGPKKIWVPKSINMLHDVGTL